MLTIVPTVAERQSAELGSETIQRASRSFRFHGALVLENIVDVATISKAHRAFDNLYFRYLDRSDRDDVLKVGDHRLMITIPLVLYGMFRYLYLIYMKMEGGGPEEVLLRDRPMLGTVVVCAILIICVLYI